MIKIRYILLFFIILFLGCTQEEEKVVVKKQVNGEMITKTVIYSKRVGFGIDDILLFSSTNYMKAKELGLVENSKEFWEYINSNDEINSVIKKKSYELVTNHLKKGDEVFIITERGDYNSDILRLYINKKFGIKTNNIYFVSKGKLKKMIELKLDLYYGSSDEEIEDSLIAGIKPIRIKRNPASISKKNYTPGKYFEEIIEGSEY